MPAGKSPKTIATINFKGGVGKTTATWCLGDIISSSDNKALIFDLDAQTSLTQAIRFNEDGELANTFQNWLDSAVENEKTIHHALVEYMRPGRAGAFNFPAGGDFVYQLTNGLHFVPSVEDLYWTELSGLDMDGGKDFLRRLLGEIENSAQLPGYDYVLFDCPPSFTALSYSVLACCDLVLIPVHPDFFAARGTNLILSNFDKKIAPFPKPEIAVFASRARTYAEKPTREAREYMAEVADVCEKASRGGQQARFLNSWIPDRAGIKRAIIGGGVPAELAAPFQELWTEITGLIR